MKQVFEKLKKVYEHSGHAVRFVNSHFGLRAASASPLPIPLRRSLNRAMRLWVTLLVIILAAFIGLIWQFKRQVDALLDAGKPFPNINLLYSGWHNEFMGAVATAVCMLLLFVWAVSLRKHYQLKRIFSIIPLLLTIGILCIKPIARLTVEARLLSLFNKGLSLFEDPSWDSCYIYYTKLLSVFPSCFISDNCLGRMGGAKYHLKDYDRALEHYSRLLLEWPDTDVKDNIVQSLDWTIKALGTNYPADVCAGLYRANSLKKLGISPFEFFLSPPSEGEAGAPMLFGSIHPDITANSFYQKIGRMLDIYPEDEWSSRAAFLIGNREKIDHYTNSPYYKSAKVVEAWHLQGHQQYAEAAKLYEDFIQTCPNEPEAARVRELLAKCYLGAMQIEQALTNLASGSKGETMVPNSTYFFFLNRFAFLDSSARSKALFDNMCYKIPTRMSIDMAYILKERLALEEKTDPQELETYSKYARRAILLTATPTDSEDNSDASINRLIEKKFDYGTNLIQFINCRLAQTQADSREKHLFDRFYDFDSNLWPDAGRTSYTDLLAGYADRHARALLASATTPREGLLIAERLVKNVKDRSLIDRPVNEFCESLITNKAPLGLESVPALKSIAAANNRDTIDRLVLPLLSSQSLTISGLSNAFYTLGIFPTVTNRSAILNLTTNYLRMIGTDTNFDRRLIEIVNLLRTSSRRSFLMASMEPLLIDSLVQTSTDPGKRESMKLQVRALGLDALKNYETFGVAEDTFVRYIKTWPDDPLECNVCMWLAWLKCYQANDRGLDSIPFVEAYQRAVDYYHHVAQKSKQERIRIIALESERKIRRKLHQVTTGAVKFKDIVIPNELVVWGDSRFRLDGTTWGLNKAAKGSNEPPTKVGELSFVGKHMLATTEFGRCNMEFHFYLRDAGHYEVYGTGDFSGQTIVVSLSITGGACRAELSRFEESGKEADYGYSMNLLSGRIR